MEELEVQIFWEGQEEAGGRKLELEPEQPQGG